MQIVRDLAGYSYGRSDLVRRAMSKKKADVMAQEEEYFVYGKLFEDGTIDVPGCVRNGVPEAEAKSIFKDMVKFASYAFNKSHAAAYAVLAYETAWLKKYYPAEFMAALMTSVKGDAKQISKYIRNCKEMGISVLPPDVNQSEKQFSVFDGAVRFGLMGIKSVGDAVIDEIIRARQEHGPAKDFEDFINHLDISKINKKAVESLIQAGAFDTINPNRAQLMAVYESFLESAHNTSKNNVAGQLSLFGDMGDFGNHVTSAMGMADVKTKMPDIRNFDRTMILAMEKEVTGVYISGHPLDDYAARIEEVSTITAEALDSEDGVEQKDDGRRVVIAGMIVGRRTMITKKNTMMAFLQIEDLYGTAEVIVFPNVYERVRDRIRDESIVVIRGSLQLREDEQPKIIASEIEDIDAYRSPLDTGAESREAAAGGNADAYGAPGVPAAPAESGRDSGGILLNIPPGKNPEEIMSRVSDIIRRYPGQRRIVIKMQETGKKMRSAAGVRPCDDLYAELYELICTLNLL